MVIMKNISRRQFVKGSLAATAGLGIASSFASTAHAAIRGANEDIRIAVIGLGGKGSAHVNDFRKLKGVRIVALCDPDTKHIASNAKKFADDQQKPATYTDFRKVLDDKNIDAIVIATPNHLHSLITIWACQAGKDVYVEKPISHNIFEGRKAIEATRKYKRIVQTGTQNRSDIGLIPFMEYLHEGNIGALKYVHTLCYRRRESIGLVNGPQPIPATLDYDLWTGPAELRPLRRKRLHYDWHWDYETGNGDLGNQGVHEIDLALWAIGADKLAPRVVSVGGRYGYVDDANTANTQVTILDYKPAPVICELRNLPISKQRPRSMDNHLGIGVGIIVKCEQGYFAGGRGGGWVYDNSGNRVKKFGGDGGGKHQQNFIDAVRSRKASDLKADIEKGHISAAAAHMASISYRLGTKLQPEAAAEVLKDYKPAADSWKSVQQHLFMNWIDLAKEGVTVGPWLEMDTATERFKQDSQYGAATWANEMLTRNYRAPFIVPQNV